MFRCGDNMENIKTVHIKVSNSRKVFVVLNTLLMLILTFIFFAPYLHVLAKSLNSAKDTSLGGIALWPRVWSWDNYNVVLQDTSIIRGFLLSVARVVVGSLISLFLDFSTAYVLLKPKLRFKKAIILFLTLPMFINGGIIANLVVFSKLGVYDTFLVYVLPGSFSFYYMVIIRTYLAGIPASLMESARIDGASEFTILFKIMLPLSMPIVATILLWCAVGHWNDWTTTLYYTMDKNLQVLQYVLQASVKEATKIQEMIQDALATGRPLGDISTDISGDSIQSAQIIVSTIPIVMIYPFLQKYFVKGVMIGSVKE